MLRLLRFLTGRPLRTRRSPAAIRTALPSIQATDWLSTWAVAWGIPDLAARVEIVYGRRIRRSLGRCMPRTGEIRLNPALLQAGDDVLREVLCHEAAHAATWILHGSRARPHGREWKALMRRAGYEPRVRWAPRRGAKQMLRI